MDAPLGARTDPDGLRRAVQPDARLAPTQSLGLELPAADWAGQGAGQAAIQRWKRTDWPRLKKRRGRRPDDRLCPRIGPERAPPSRLDVGTRGQTPVLQMRFNWKHLSAIAGITTWTFYFRLYPGTIKSAQLVEFLGHLRRHLRRKLLVIWAGSARTGAGRVLQYVEASRGRLRLTFLPAYAPARNPVEYVWGYGKHHELPNFCPKDFAHLNQVACRRHQSMQRRPTLVTAFWEQAELPL